MTVKAITFIGTASYEETTYTCNEGSFRTKFMPVATAMIFKPDKLYVLETEQAKEKNRADLQQAFEAIKFSEVSFVRIPEGNTLDEFWQIFGIVADLVKPKDEVIFDFTNTFRSIPLLSLLAAAYVRVVVEDVTIKRILYGAYQKGQVETPILDLTLALTLLDWINATTSFRETGRANFGALLQSDAHFAGVGKHLKELSTNLYTSRTAAILSSAHELQGRLAGVQTTPEMEPFRMLLGQIEHDAAKMALANPTEQEHAREALEKMLNLIDWYIEKEMVNQALTYAREWLVSLELYRNGQPLFVEHRERDAAARRLDGHSDQTIRDVWQKLRITSEETNKPINIRNDVAHCGMNPGALSADKIVAGAREIAQELRALLPKE